MNYLSGHGVKWVLFPSCCVLALSLSVSGLAQQLAAPTSQGAIIKGSVVDALSGRPLRGALVRLQASDSRVIVTTRTSDASGRFEISPVPSGRYDVWATLTGYIEGGYLQRAALAPRAPLDVPDQGTVSVPLRLWKHGVISGQVFDDAGDPAVGVTVMALEEDWSFETVHLIQSKGRAIVTDDQGAYRLADLLPGTFVIGIAGAGTFHAGGRATGLDVAYPTTYAPGVLLPDQAERITLGAAEIRAGVNLRMPPVDQRARSVRGHIVDGPSEAPWIVELLPSLPSASTLSDLDIRRVNTTDGHFGFDAIPPGPYVLRATAFTEYTNVKTLGRTGFYLPSPPDPDRSIETAPTYWAETTVAVTEDGPDEVVLHSRRGQQIRGTVVWDGAGTKPPEPKVLMTPIFVKSLDGRLFTAISSARLDPTGRFVTVGLPPGRYGLDLDADPRDGWIFRSISVAGRNLPDGVIELQDDDVTDVVIALTDRWTQIAGSVRTPQSKPAPDSAVFVFPTDRRQWHAFGFNPVRVLQLHPDADGRYVVERLPPGEYNVVATTGDIPDRWQNPAFLAGLVPGAVVVHLNEGSRVTQNLTVRVSR